MRTLTISFALVSAIPAITRLVWPVLGVRRMNASKRSRSAPQGTACLALACLALAGLAIGCGDSHVPADQDGGAGADGDAGTLIRRGDLTFAARDALFTLCDCHHGCGWGADGVVNVLVTNGTSSSVAVEIVDLSLVSADGEVFPASVSGGNLRWDPGPALSRAIPAGSTIDAPLHAYIDLPSAPVAGPYRVRVNLEVDGLANVIETPPVDVPLNLTCF